MSCNVMLKCHVMCHVACVDMWAGSFFQSAVTVSRFLVNVGDFRQKTGDKSLAVAFEPHFLRWERTGIEMVETQRTL
jgi:hypothetical protein